MDDCDGMTLSSPKWTSPASVAPSSPSPESNAVAKQSINSPASRALSSLSPESNGAPKQSIKSLTVVQTVSIGKRKRSPYWGHFDKVLVNGLPKAVCKYCSRNIGCDPRSGTTPLKNHILRCKQYSPKSISNGTPEQSSPSTAAVVPWDMFPAARTVQQMMETMERLMEDPFAYGSITWQSVPSTQGNGYRSGRTPWAIRETETSYKIKFDMPGMTRNDVNVWVEDNVLVVEAEKVTKRGQDSRVDIVELEDDEWPVESYGKYSSRITLLEMAELEKIKAEVKDGVLYITIPKARGTSKRVEINVQ